MNKKTFLKKILQLSTLILLANTSSCVVAFNCTKIGYSQQVDGAFFDEKSKTGYFVYSYLEKSDKKNYSLYKIDINGKVEKILDLDSKSNFNKNIWDKSLTYTFSILNDNKVLIKEMNKISNPNHKTTEDYYIYKKTFYLGDLNNKKLIYKKDSELVGYGINENLSNNKKFFLEYIDNSKFYVFDIENGKYINSFIPQGLDNTSEPSKPIAKWIGETSNIIMPSYLKWNDNEKSFSIYEIKDTSINKIVSDYKYKEQDLGRIDEAIDYKDNSLLFSVLASNNNSSTKNIYKLDFTKNNINLVESNVKNEQKKIELPKIILKASEKMYLEYLSGSDYSSISNKVEVLDYLKKLPKGYFNDETLCGDYKTTDKLGQMYR